MQIRMIKAGICVAALVAAMSVSAQDVPWKVYGGKAAVQFFPDNLATYGIQVANMNSTAPGEYPMEGGIGFEVQKDSNFQVMPEDNVFGHHLGGSVNISGGFELRVGKRTVRVSGIRISADGAEQDSPLVIENGVSGAFAPVLRLEHPVTYLDVHRGLLTMGWTDMRLTAQAANALGVPRAAGALIGGYSVWANVQPTIEIPRPGGGNGSGFLDNTNVDMNLFNLSSLMSLGRDGVAYPNGISGFATLTTSCNKGTSPIDWFQAMNANHPVIAQQLYRVRDGRIELISDGFLKHGFLATNTTNSNCGVGVQPGTNQLLGIGLTDTYGTGNNGDRYWLGPRSEVNPHTGVWTPFGSYFDVGINNSTPDGARSLTSSQVSTLPLHANRMMVRDADLIVPVGETRQYVYEAYYLNTSEINLQNQIGSRMANISWNGSSWATSDAGSFLPDLPAIDRYVQIVNATKNIPAGDVNATSNKVTNLAEGWIYLSCNPIRLGGGLWRYELAIFNYTSDRQIRQLTVPMMPGMTVTNIGFRDQDTNAGNNWSGSYNAGTGVIDWSTQTFAQNPNANSLKYGTLYNFTFTANVAPVANTATMGLFKTGAVMTNTAALMTAPNGNVPAATYLVTMGVPVSGGVANLAASDNSYAIIDEDLGADFLHTCSAVITGTSPIASPGQVNLTVESSADMDGRFQTIEFWNYTTSTWTIAGTGLVNTTDGTLTGSISGAAAANYAHPTTKEVKARISMDLGAAETTALARFKIDKAAWLVGL